MNAATPEHKPVTEEISDSGLSASPSSAQSRFFMLRADIFFIALAPSQFPFDIRNHQVSLAAVRACAAAFFEED